MPTKKRKASAGDGDKAATRKAKAPRAAHKVRQAMTSAQEAADMKADPARQAVFNTAELLEIIISSLPLRSICSAYRVCSQWKALVDSSKVVKEKLLFVSSTAKQIWQVQEPVNHNGSWELSLTTADWPLSELTGFIPGVWAPVFVQPVRLHPLLELIHPGKSAGERLVYFMPDRVKMALGRNARTLAASLDTPSPVSDTQTNLLLDAPITDPPCKLAKVIQTWSVRQKRIRGGSQDSDYGEMEYTVKSDFGITFRDIIVSMHRPGKCYTDIDVTNHNVSGVTLEEVLQDYRDMNYDIAKVDDKITIELPSNVVPSEEEWQTIK